MKNWFYLLLLTLLMGYTINAQQNIHFNQDNQYRGALELFQKEKYGSAKKIFTDLVSSSDATKSIQLTYSEYYLALCAIYLFNEDAPILVTQFERNNPESPLKGYLSFEMAKFHYNKKEYQKAVQYFKQTDISKITKQQKHEYYFKLGYSYFILDSTDNARLAFFEIKDIETQYTSPALYYYSHILYSQKNYASAASGFLRLKNDETFGHIVPYYITQCLFFQGKYDELIEYAEPIIDSLNDSRQAEIAKLIGESYYMKGKYPLAIPYLERYQKKGKEFVQQDAYQLGYCYYYTKEFEKAIPLFEKASMSNTSLGQNALNLLADCFLKKGDKNKARMAFSGASKMEYDLTIKENALFNLAIVTYELSYSPFNDAIKSFNEYLTLYPASPRSDIAYNYLTQAYMITKNYKDAIATIEKIKNKDNSIKKAYQKIAFFRGLELVNETRYQEALSHFEKSIQFGDFDRQYKTRCKFWLGEVNARLNNDKEAVLHLNEFILMPGAISTEEFNTAHYSLGYLNFNIKNYADANTCFRKFISINKENYILQSDAYNRLGDGYFMNKEYEEAINNYKKSYEIGKSNKDYALFQQAFSIGLLGKHEEKIVLLNKLLTENSTSSYADDAVFETGRSSFILNKNRQAEMNYLKVIKDFPKSSYVLKSYVQLGLLYYNEDRNEEALKAYKFVVKEFPGSQEARNSLIGIKNIYVEMGDVDSYIAFTDGLGQYANVSLSEQDSLMYQSAENLYMQGNCSKAQEQFSKYIEKFSNGGFVINSYFYRGDCYSQTGNLEKAVSDFNYVIEQSRSIFTEQALVGAAKLSYKNKNYQAAVNYYARLEENAELPANKLEARMGLLRCYYELKEYNNIPVVGKRILFTDKLPVELEKEARMTIAKSYYEDKRFILALEEFKTLSNNVVTVEGAESKYRIAEIYFNQNDLEKSEKEIFEFIDMNSPHQFWLAKSFLLLSDIYTIKKDAFQASQTLKSIIDYYDNKTDGIYDTAKQKLESINEKAADKNIVPAAEEVELKF